ncbi:MAG: DUF2807 domain-containing protein [Myxococcaceae bacterium]|nr:DUF2807 domain-containing protein [Myxococcaceae bacterium]
MRLFLVLTFAVLAACHPAEPLAGDGVLVERSWPLDGVSVVRASGPMSVQVLVGSGFTAGLRAEGDANVVGALRRRTEGRALVLDASALAPSQPLQLTVTLPALLGLHASDGTVATANAMRGGRLDLSAQDSGRVLVNGVDADSLQVTVSRASTVDAAGVTRLVTVTARDVGTAALGSLRSRVALIEASELSSVRVHALEAVRGAASRASRVDVAGEPVLRSLSADEGSFVRQQPGSAPRAVGEQRSAGEG